MDSDPDGIAYDDDFEEASEDELTRTRSFSKSCMLPPDKGGTKRERSEIPAQVPSTVKQNEPSSSQDVSKPLSCHSKSPVPVEVSPEVQSACPPRAYATKLPLREEGALSRLDNVEGHLEMPQRTVSTGSSTSSTRRLVRGKISLCAEEGSAVKEDRRPGTGDSGRSGASSAVANPALRTSAASAAVPAAATASALAAAAAAAAAGGTGNSHNNKPMWLQHDDSMLPARHKEQQWLSPPSNFGPRNSQGETNSRCLGSRGRNSQESDPFADLYSGSTRATASRCRRGLESGSVADIPHEDEHRTGTADGDQRKIKRLQQEIQRLTQRLKENELFSSQDDGLPKFTLDEVELGCQIAQGGFSSVYHAVWRSTPCAIKKIFDPVITAELREEFENEVRMLRRLRHPNVVTLMAVCRVPPALSILTELVAGGSLFELLHSPPKARRKNVPDCEIGALMPVVQEAACGLAYLHWMLVVHRDIKSQNVLLTPGPVPVAKLCDFGLARMKSELCTGTMQWAGTAAYMAPELFAKKRYTEAVDVFAFGTMLWEVASTEIPHANLDAADIAHRVQHKDAAGLSITHSWPKSLKSLLRSTLAANQESRPAMVEVARQLATIALDIPAPD